MAFGEHKIGFREVDLRYAELKRQHEAGTINDEEFDTQLKQMMVRDDEDRWWAKSRKTGNWHYHDGEAWVRDTPPGHGPPPTLPEESTSDQGLRLERSRTSQTNLPGSAHTQDRSKETREVPRWAIVAAGLVGIGIIATGVAIWYDPAPTYALVEDDSGKLSVEVPSEWDELIPSESEGEKGRNWSSFAGGSIGPSLTAVNSLDAWRSGSRPHRGVYIATSSELARSHTDEELLASGPNDYSSSCEAGARQDFDRPPYSGIMQEWNNCTGESDHKALTVVARPEDRECVVLLQIGGYLQNYEEEIQHVLDTFDADCEGIA